MNFLLSVTMRIALCDNMTTTVYNIHMLNIVSCTDLDFLGFLNTSSWCNMKTQCGEQFIQRFVYTVLQPRSNHWLVCLTDWCVWLIGVSLSSILSIEVFWLDGFLKVWWRAKSWLYSHHLILIMSALFTFRTNRLKVIVMSNSIHSPATLRVYVFCRAVWVPIPV